MKCKYVKLFGHFNKSGNLKWNRQFISHHEKGEAGKLHVIGSHTKFPSIYIKKINLYITQLSPDINYKVLMIAYRLANKKTDKSRKQYSLLMSTYGSFIF